MSPLEQISQIITGWEYASLDEVLDKLKRAKIVKTKLIPAGDPRFDAADALISPLENALIVREHVGV